MASNALTHPYVPESAVQGLTMPYGGGFTNGLPQDLSGLQVMPGTFASHVGPIQSSNTETNTRVVMQILLDFDGGEMYHVGRNQFIFVSTSPRNSGPHATGVKPYSWSMMNYLLGTPAWRMKYCTNMKNAAELLADWSLYGAMQGDEPKWLEGTRSRMKVFQNFVIGGRVRVPNLWLATTTGRHNRGGVKYGHELYMLIVPVEMSHPLEREYEALYGGGTTRRRGDDDDGGDEAGAPKRQATGDATQPRPSLASFTRNTNKELPNWRWVIIPYFSPTNEAPPPELYTSDDGHVGAALRIGIVTDKFGPREVDPHDVNNARDALYPKADSDAYWKPLYSLPELEIQLLRPPV